MKLNRFIPVIYGVVSALITFIAAVFIQIRTFKIGLSWAILSASILALIFFVMAYFRMKASITIKQIVAKEKLTPKDLAKITGLPESDFPIYNSKLQLIVPRRKWPQILAALQNYQETQHRSK